MLHSRLQPDLLERHELAGDLVPCLVHHAVGALADLLNLLEVFHVVGQELRTRSLPSEALLEVGAGRAGPGPPFGRAGKAEGGKNPPAFIGRIPVTSEAPGF